MSQGKIELDDTPEVVFSNVDRLHDLGLVAPVATEIAYKLRAGGYKIDRMPLTVNEGMSMINNLLGSF